MHRSLLALLIVLLLKAGAASALPLKAPIYNANDEELGTALLYIDYVEILDLAQEPMGKVAFVLREGSHEILLVRDDAQKTLGGRAANKRLYNMEGQLVAFYDWSSFWVYVYARDGKPLGKAKCIAFRGVCAAGVAGYLTGLLGTPSS
jgi:hypothetical protein